MNNTASMIKKNYTMHLTMMILCAMVSFVGNEILGFIFGILIYAIFVILQYGDGADRGERACTLSATVEKLQSEGKNVDPQMLTQTFNKKRALISVLASSLPFAILALVSLILADPNSVSENVLGTITRVVFLPLAWLNRLLTSLVGWDLDGLWMSGSAVIGTMESFGEGVELLNVSDAVAGIGVYAKSYDVFYITLLRAAFVVFSFVPPLAQAIGYLQGPKFRQKKLEDIAKGTRKKRKKLKVFQNRSAQPRHRKPEV